MAEAPHDDDPDAARLRPRAWRQRHRRRRRWRGRLVQDAVTAGLVLVILVLVLAGGVLVGTLGEASRNELAGLLSDRPELAWPLGTLAGVSIVVLFGLATFVLLLGSRRVSRSPARPAWPWLLAGGVAAALGGLVVAALAPPRRMPDDLGGTAPGFDSGLMLMPLLAMLVVVVLVGRPSLGRWLTASLSRRVVHQVVPGDVAEPPAGDSPAVAPGARSGTASLGALRLRNANLGLPSRRSSGQRDVRAWYGGGGDDPLTLRRGEAVGVRLPPGQVRVELVPVEPSRPSPSQGPDEPWQLDCPVVAGHLTTVTARHPVVGIPRRGQASPGGLVVSVAGPRPGRPTVPWPWRPPGPHGRRAG